MRMPKKDIRGREINKTKEKRQSAYDESDLKKTGNKQKGKT